MNKASIAASIVGVALVGLYGYLFYSLFLPPDERLIPQQAAPSISTLNPAKSNVIDVASFHLFGAEKTVEIINENPVIAAKKSTRNYRIAGSAENKVTGQSSVSLEIRPGDFSFYRPNDQIEKGVTFVKIENDSLILDVNGVFERIDNPKAKEQLFIKVSNAQAMRLARAGGYDWGWLHEWDRMTGALILKNLGLVEVDGFFSIDNASPFLLSRKIKPGDRLLAVNGKPLTPANAKELFKDIENNKNYFLLIQNERRRVSVRWSRSG